MADNLSFIVTVLPAAGHRRMPILVAISAAGKAVLVVTAHNEAATLTFSFHL
jgi:hypothetical protein